MKLGHAVIINNVASDIPGSKMDVDKLRNVFEKMHFIVHVFEDCSDNVSIYQSLRL